MNQEPLAPFVVVEGIDGCGKTTIISSLKQIYPHVLFLREPGGSLLAEELREIVLSNVGGMLSPEQQMAMFYAGRQINILKEILPYRRRGTPVICDRFEASTFAYQKCMQYVGDELIMNMPLYEKFFSLRERVVTECEPSRYIYLNVDPKVGMERRALARNQDSNHFDLAGLQEQKRRAASYLDFFRKIEREGVSKVSIVDANPPKEEVIAEVLALTELELRGYLPES